MFASWHRLPIIFLSGVVSKRSGQTQTFSQLGVSAGPISRRCLSICCHSNQLLPDSLRHVRPNSALPCQYHRPPAAVPAYRSGQWQIAESGCQSVSAPTTAKLQPSELQFPECTRMFFSQSPGKLWKCRVGSRWGWKLRCFQTSLLLNVKQRWRNL